MGVRGLTTYMDAHPYYSKPHKLHDTKVVIDGNNLVHFLYASRNIDCVHGGDYNKFAIEIRKFFKSLKECNVEPIIVLDGGTDTLDRLFPKRHERFLQRLDRVTKASETGTSNESFVPINIFEVFKIIVSEIGVSAVQSHYESDWEVAALANYFNCPVLSDDSDFYIFDVKQGFIRLSQIDKFVTTVFQGKDAPSKHLKCYIYHIDSFCAINPGIDKSSLPLLATLLGNDLLSYHHLRHFYRRIQFLPGQRVEAVISWMRECRNKAINEVLEYLQDGTGEINDQTYSTRNFSGCTKNNDYNQTDIESMVQVSLKSYELEESNLIYVLKNKESQIDKLFFTSMLVAPCGSALPDKFISAYHQGNLRGYFISIINTHRMFLSPQIEDLSSESSYKCSRYIRQIIYGILLSHQPHIKEIHNKICVGHIKEFDRNNSVEKVVIVEPVYSTVKGSILPNMNEIYNMEKTARQKLLADILRVKRSTLLSVPPGLQLLLGSIIYFLINCSPKPSKEFLVSMIMCIIYYNVLQKRVVKVSTETDVNEKAHKFLTVLDSITESEKRVVSEQFETCFAESSMKLRNSFNLKIIHSYSQLQTCLYYLISLNKLLDLPLETPELHEMFNGTVLYSLATALVESPKPGFFPEYMLGKETACCKLYCMLLNKILKNIPEDFGWSRLKYKPKPNIESTKNSSRIKAVNVVEVSNKFQTLCNLKRH